jgi:outer membrane protein OmpA-like peptidoglycan-associated protein
MKPVVITGLQPVPNSNFFSFEYNFIADGTEQYLTFGTYTEEDTLGAKKKLVGTQTISLVLDNFQLLPEDKKETYCRDFLINKEKIYNYNFRHKEMDYSLFGKGELAISFTKTDSLFTTIIKEPVQPPKADTLKLGDVFFDFNKANLKPAALEMLATFFTRPGNSNGIDSIYVEGHTDSIGSDSRNLQLSLERSESIRQWLLKNNILTSSSIQVHAFGRSKPVASNSTPQGRALNRRVELIVFRKIPSK